MASNIILSFDHNHWTGVFDLSTGQYYRYNKPADESREGRGTVFPFELFGGRQTYLSFSGKTGEGCVPARPGLVKVPSLRTSVSKPPVPRGGEIFPGGGTRVIDLGLAPGEPLDGDGTLLFAEPIDNGRAIVRLVRDYQVNTEMLKSLLEEKSTPQDKPKKVKLTSWVSDHRGLNEKTTLTVSVFGRLSPEYKMTLKRVLELVYWDELYDPEAMLLESQNQWLSGLGVVVGSDGFLYHQAGGILRRPVKIDALETREGIEKAAPWVKVVNSYLDYVKMDGGNAILVRSSPGLPEEVLDYRQYLEVLSGVKNVDFAVHPNPERRPWSYRGEEDLLAPWERRLLGKY